MVLDLNRLFEVEGESVIIDYSLNLSYVEHWGTKPFSQPISIKGKAENRTGIVTLDYSANFSADLICDRCLCEVHRDYSPKFTHKLVRELFNDDPESEYIVAEGGILNLSELLTGDLILNLPVKNLCNEDCKGLCLKCGENLNETQCGCSTKEVDPRLAKLLTLLD